VRTKTKPAENTIQEPELRLLIKEIPDLRLIFQEIQAPPPGAPDSLIQELSKHPEKFPGALPQGIPVAGKIAGRMEQFFCLVERPGHWKRYLLTQKNLLRVMSPYGCARLCKDMGIKNLTLSLNNPPQWPTEWLL